MDLKVDSIHSIEQKEIGLKVEGDLGDLQIIEESDSDDDDGDTQVESSKVDTIATVPHNLLQTGSTPVFGTVAVTNSENVQFGNNTFFNGPVTIKQVIQTSGVDNASYIKTDNEHLSSKYPPKSAEPALLRKFKLKTWHKLSLTAIGVLTLGSICAVLLVTLHSDKDNFSDLRNEDGSNYILVLGLSRQNVQTIVLSIFLVLLTISWVFWSALTPEPTHFEGVQKNEAFQCSVPSISKGFIGEDLLIAPGHLRIVSRTDWLAQPVEEHIDEIRKPVPWVIITHTATEGCTVQSSCVLRVRLIQTFHIESKEWSDIGYNFLVGGDGSVYYGRGWDLIGAHTKGYNKYSIAIAFIGTFNTETPTKNQVEACKKLIKLGVAEGKLDKDYKLFGHRQLMSTLSPGDKVFDIIKTWSHFVNTTDADLTQLIPNY